MLLGALLKTVRAIKIVLNNRKYLLSFIILGISILIILFQIQVVTTPGNSVSFQLKLYQLKDWFLLGMVSMVNSLFIVMQVYLYKLQKANAKNTNLLGGIAVGSVGTSSGILTSIFGTATCSLCVSALFGFLGSNTVIFMVNNKDWITIGALFVLTISLILTSRRLTTTCEVCKVNL